MNATETAKNTEYFLSQGLNKAIEGDFKGAIAHFDQAIQINPNNAHAYHNRGLARFKFGETHKAIEDFTQALRLNPNYTEAYVGRGNAYRQLQDYLGAIIDYTCLVRLNSKDAKAYYNRGFVYSRVGEKQKAIEDYQTAVKLFYERGDDVNGRRAWENLKQLQLLIPVKSQENTTSTHFSSKHSCKSKESKHGFDSASQNLLFKLIGTLQGDRQGAMRLISQVRMKNPGKSAHWCVEKVIYDLERDRSR